MSLKSNKNFFILAGESSSDYIGSILMDGLVNNLDKKPYFFGVGGELMQKKGLQSIFDMNSLNIIGLVDTILNYRSLKKQINYLVDLIMFEKPEAIITIDSKGFSLNLARELKKKFLKSTFKCPLIHFVPPTIWAYGKSRSKKWIGIHDGLFCLFKKEVEIFNKLNINCIYAGNPFVEKFLKEKYRFSNVKSTKEKKLLLNNKKLNVLLLPGSRDTEINYILLDFIKLIQLTNNNNISWIMPTTKLQFPKIIKILNKYKYNYKDNVKILILEDNYKILNTADLAVACSGTITLELVLFSIPTIALYKSDWLSSFVGRYLVDFNNVILPNFLLNKQLVPFLFQEKCNSYYINKLLIEYINSIDTMRVKYTEASNEILRNLEYFEKRKISFSNKSSHEILNIINNFSY